MIRNLIVTLQEIEQYQQQLEVIANYADEPLHMSVSKAEAASVIRSRIADAERQLINKGIKVRGVVA